MKKLLIISVGLMMATGAYAQCSKNHPIFNDKTSSPAPVHRLGSDPEFPFLRNLSTPQQVAAAMKSRENSKRYPRQMRELNTLLTQAGFSNGTQDVTASSVSSYRVMPGTTGNMGSGKLTY